MANTTLQSNLESCTSLAVPDVLPDEVKQYEASLNRADEFARSGVYGFIQSVLALVCAYTGWKLAAKYVSATQWAKDVDEKVFGVRVSSSDNSLKGYSAAVGFAQANPVLVQALESTPETIGAYLDDLSDEVLDNIALQCRGFLKIWANNGTPTKLLKDGLVRKNGIIRLARPDEAPTKKSNKLATIGAYEGALSMVAGQIRSIQDRFAVPNTTKPTIGEIIDAIEVRAKK